MEKKMSLLDKEILSTLVKQCSFKETIQLKVELGELDQITLDTLQNCFPCETKELIKIAFAAIATKELTKRQFILDFPCYDFVGAIDALNDQKEAGESIELPRWTIMALVDVVCDGYQEHIECIEDVVNAVLDTFKQDLEYLWNPYKLTDAVNLPGIEENVHSELKQELRQPLTNTNHD